MTASKVSSLNSLFNTIFDDALYVARENALLPGLVTNKTATGMAARKISTYPTVTAAEVADGVDFANATEWTKTLSATITPKEVMAQVVITDQRLATDPEDARQSSAQEMGMAIATKIDADLAALFDDFSSDLGASGSALTIQRCANAMAKLRVNHAPNPINIVLHPYGWLDIWTELGQPASQKALLGDVANDAMRDFYVGDWMGAMWYTNTNIKTSGSDAYSAAFHRDALVLDTRMAPRQEVERDASLRAYEVNITAWYGVGEQRDGFGIQLTHDATAPS